MKIGDKVCFLSETGGGIVAGFQGNNVVLVEDEDGFQIPMPISEVVLVSSQDYHTSSQSVSQKPQSAVSQSEQRADISAEAALDISIEALQQSDKTTEKHVEETFLSEEREGGNELACYLAFVPVNIHEISRTQFEVYIVNDSNYFVRYVMLSAAGGEWVSRHDGELTPNSKRLLETIEHKDLNALMHIAVQYVSFKRDKGFALQPPMSTMVDLNPVEFYNLRVFLDNPFFDTPAYVFALMKHVEQPLTDAEAVEKEPARQSKAASNLVTCDLRPDALCVSAAGMSHSELLQNQLKRFQEVMDEHKGEHGKKIVFIHGKGEGILRHAIVNTLNYRYKVHAYQDASFQEYGYGAIEVTIK